MAQWFSNKGQVLQAGCAMIAATCAVVMTVEKLRPGTVSGMSWGLWGSISLLALSIYALIAVFRGIKRPSVTVLRAMYHPSDKNKTGKDVTALVQTLVKERGPSFLIDQDTFGDPFREEFKALTVEYTYGDEWRTKTIAQDQWFNLP